MIRKLRALGGLLLCLLATPPPDSLGADAKMVGVEDGVAITGTIGMTVENVGFAGTFAIEIGPPFGGPNSPAYCVDIHNPIQNGDIVPQVAFDYPCEVVWIVNNTYPNAAPVLSVDREAAAVQAAIWFYTDGFDITSPNDVEARTDAIIAAAQSQCLSPPPIPQSITLTPANDTNCLPDTHAVTATVLDTLGAPLAGAAITVSVSGVSGPQVFNGTTNAAGQFVVTYSNPSMTPGSDTITASMSFTVPIGQKFKAAGKQGIILAGSPQPGQISGVAHKSWVACTTTTTTSTSTTSTTSTTTTTTSTTSTSSTTTTTTSTTTTSTTSTTVPVCRCDEVPFLFGREGRINNEARVLASVGVNAPGGVLRLSQSVFMPDGTVAIGSRVELGNAANVASVLADTPVIASSAVVRGSVGPAPSLPIVTPFCTLPAFTCGTQIVRVLPNTSTTLSPGTYGRVQVLNGGTLILGAGTYQFCGLKTGRGTTVASIGPSTLNVAGDVSIGSGGHVFATTGGPMQLNVGGRKVRISQGAVLEAAVVAPNAQISLGRSSVIDGCFCADRGKSDKDIRLQCSES